MHTTIHPNALANLLEQASSFDEDQLDEVIVALRKGEATYDSTIDDFLYALRQSHIEVAPFDLHEVDRD